MGERVTFKTNGVPQIEHVADRLASEGFVALAAAKNAWAKTLAFFRRELRA